MNRGISTAFSVLALTVLSTGVAQAQWYGGVGGGHFKDKAWWVTEASAVQIFGGYQISPYLAGELSLSRSGTVSCCSYDGGNYTLLTPWLVGRLPFGNFAILFKVGLSDWYLKDDYRNQHEIEAVTGMGVQYDFSGAFGVRIERQSLPFTYTDTGGNKLGGDNLATFASIVYRF